MKISTSFLSCKKIEKSLSKLSLTDADYIHVDVVDNKLVQGRKIPFRKLKNIYKYTSKRLDVHLMVQNPKKYIKKFASLNTEYITFHLEIDKKIEENLALIHKFGIKNGLAISPKTDLSRLKPFINQIDMVLLMSVEPGYGGQTFLPETWDRIKIVQQMIRESKTNTLISVDGGITAEIAKQLSDIDIIVSGSYVTNEENYQKQIDLLRQKNPILEDSIEVEKIKKTDE